MKITKLSDIATIRISNVDKKVREGQKQVKLCNYTDVYYNWAITNNKSDKFMVASASDPEIEKFSLNKGDVVLTKDSETKDDIGISAYVADDIENLVLGYHCALIRPKENKLVGQYLNVILHSAYAQKYFKNSASGSGQRYTLTEDIINDFPVPYVLPEDQEKLSVIFSIIDQIVESNNNFVEKMEQYVRSIFNYWFLQFEFPDKEKKPYKSNGGLLINDETKGKEVPVGWKYTKLEKLCSLKNGINYDKNDSGNKKYSIVNVRNISSSLTIIDASDLDSITLESNNADRYILGNNDIIIARSGNPGATRLLLNPDSNIIFCGFIICCTPNESCNRYYLTNYLKIFEGTNVTKTGGSILTNVSQDTLKNLDVLMPLKEIVEEFNDAVGPIYEMINNAMNVNNKLKILIQEMIAHLLNVISQR